MCGIFALVEGLRTERRGGASFIADELTPGDTGMEKQVPQSWGQVRTALDSNRGALLCTSGFYFSYNPN